MDPCLCGELLDILVPHHRDALNSTLVRRLVINTKQPSYNKEHCMWVPMLGCGLFFLWKCMGMFESNKMCL